MKNNKPAEKCQEFESYSYEDFKKYAYDEVKNYVSNLGIADFNVDLLCESFFCYLTAKFSKPFYTGLVFVGYGESEIYPALYPVDIVLGTD